MMLPLPLWPDAETAEGAIFFANADACFAAWKAKGVSNAFALGMLANAEAETSLNPNAKGDYIDVNGERLPWSSHPKGTPTSFGLFQWKAARLKVIKDGCGIDLITAVMMGKATIQQSVDAAWFELNGPMSKARIAMEQMRTASGSATEACALFELAGASGAGERRGSMATRWTEYFAKKGF
jgi:hypothetical protein